jgi:hypothetical protein
MKLIDTPEFKQANAAVQVALQEHKDIQEYRAECRRKRIPYAKTISKESRAIMKAETVSRRVLKDRAPEVWVAMIEDLEEPIKTRAAKIVWWDFFGNRFVSERWPHLDGYLNRPIEFVAHEDLVSALYKLGYSAYYATNRIDTEEEIEDTEVAEEEPADRYEEFLNA